MPRKNLIRTSHFPYHITIRSNNREWFQLELSNVWKICLESIQYALKKHPVNIQAFVLMSNHYHLQVWTPKCDIDRFMFYLNSSISEKIRSRTNRINRIFGDRYKWCIITSEEYYQTVLKYLYQNPLRANLCNRCENYPYSTLNYVKNQRVLPFNLYQPFFGDLKTYLNWINQETLEKYKFSDAIRKPIYKPHRSSSSRRIT